MAFKLRQSTASQEVPLGIFLDDADGDTQMTGLTIANTDIKIWKTGATSLANKNSGGATHISNGIYYAVLDATDSDTIGPLVIFVHVSDALAVRLECEVLDEAVYDTWFGTSALVTAASLATALGTADDATLAAIAALNNVSLAAVADAVWDEDATGHQTQGTFGQAIGDPAADADTIWALVNTNLNATVSSRASQTSVDTIDDFLDSEVAAILADTDELQTDWVNGGRLDLLIDAIKAKTDALPTDPADQSAVEAAITAATSPLATQTSVNTIDDFLDTEVAAILADTNELQTDWVNGGRLDLLIDAIKAKTDLLAFSSGNVDANVVALDGNTTLIDRLAESVGLFVKGTVTADLTATSFESDLTTIDDEIFTNRALVWLTGDNQYQAVYVEAFVSVDGVFTTSPSVTTPQIGDTFLII